MQIPFLLQIFCLHGGLSPTLDTTDHIRALDRVQEVRALPAALLGCTSKAASAACCLWYTGAISEPITLTQQLTAIRQQYDNSRKRSFGFLAALRPLPPAVGVVLREAGEKKLKQGRDLLAAADRE